MKIYNEEKTQILSNVDLGKGYLKNDRLLISNEEAEESHFEVKTYDNGGTEKFKVIDKPYKPAEYEEIQVYVLCTNEELINNLKQKLSSTDYQVLKWQEGELTDEQFEPMRLQRKAWREEIRSLGG